MKLTCGFEMLWQKGKKLASVCSPTNSFPRMHCHYFFSLKKENKKSNLSPFFLKKSQLSTINSPLSLDSLLLHPKWPKFHDKLQETGYFSVSFLVYYSINDKINKKKKKEEEDDSNYSLILIRRRKIEECRPRIISDFFFPLPHVYIN